MAPATPPSTSSDAAAAEAMAQGAGFAEDRSGAQHARYRTLASAGIDEEVLVVALAMDDDLRDWLSAVGIGVGESLCVLRRAAFGGPLHVRTSAGGEFALNLALAGSIFVEAQDHSLKDPIGAEDSAA
jgi:ferrous iron transport protein A